VYSKNGGQVFKSDDSTKINEFISTITNSEIGIANIKAKEKILLQAEDSSYIIEISNNLFKYKDICYRSSYQLNSKLEDIFKFKIDSTELNN
jgi:hypothetical protein